MTKNLSNKIRILKTTTTIFAFSLSCPSSTFLIPSLWKSHLSYETITIEKVKKGGNFYGKIRYRQINQHISQM